MHADLHHSTRQTAILRILRGAPVRMCFHAASTCVSMSMYEELKHAARELL